MKNCVNKHNWNHHQVKQMPRPVVTRWPGSPKVWGSIPGCATKIVRCKNLAFNFRECLSWLGYHVNALVPCISGEPSPK